MANIKEKLKNKGFWCGLLTAAAGFIGGSMSAPDFMVQVVKLIGQLIGGIKW